MRAPTFDFSVVTDLAEMFDFVLKTGLLGQGSLVQTYARSVRCQRFYGVARFCFSRS